MKNEFNDNDTQDKYEISLSGKNTMLLAEVWRYYDKIYFVYDVNRRLGVRKLEWKKAIPIYTLIFIFITIGIISLPEIGYGTKKDGNCLYGLLFSGIALFGTIKTCLSIPDKVTVKMRKLPCSMIMAVKYRYGIAFGLSCILLIIFLVDLVFSLNIFSISFLPFDVFDVFVVSYGLVFLLLLCKSKSFTLYLINSIIIHQENKCHFNDVNSEDDDSETGSSDGDRGTVY